MSNININVISEASGAFDQLFGKIQVPLASFIEERFKKGRENCIALSIFDERSSNNFAEGYGGLGASPTLQPVGEGGDYPQLSVEQRALQMIENIVFKGELQLTREIVEDAKGDLKIVLARMGANRLPDSYYKTIETLCSGLLVAAMTNQDAFTYGNKTFSTKSYDGKKIFATNHSIGGKTYSNVYQTAFSAGNLSKLTERQQNCPDESGKPAGYSPDTIIIPNDGGAKAAVFAAIGADKDPATAYNAYNYHFGMWNVIVDPYLNGAVTSSEKFPFIIFDSKYNKDADGNVFQNRVDLEITSKKDEKTDNNVWRAYSRFSAGFVDFGHMMLGGAGFGSTL